MMAIVLGPAGPPNVEAKRPTSATLTTSATMSATREPREANTPLARSTRPESPPAMSDATLPADTKTADVLSNGGQLKINRPLVRAAIAAHRPVLTAVTGHRQRVPARALRREG